MLTATVLTSRLMLPLMPMLCGRCCCHCVLSKVPQRLCNKSLGGRFMPSCVIGERGVCAGQLVHGVSSFSKTE
ncbi:hypothetical protein B0I35DRAFT_437843 [Stachybotrys elegans]|uniref:Secreted protein n=1 Tax=Stachybotrys elegans TaxID=80388 RepID=A0A8K0WND9_9HYPO|nr:hypothetical protein B0I35DRAFT_437843 [Stachybotrys elegans]